MQDKCPKCGEPLITQNIKKELGHGSIDYPVSQTCPKCNWSRDLTGAGDIVSKPFIPGEMKKEEVKIPPAPPKTAPAKAPSKPVPSQNLNKIITIALAILVLGGIVWAFFPSSAPNHVESPKPTATVTVTQTTVQPTRTPVAEVTPTGKQIPVKLESRRGFIPNTQTIKPGDEIVWRNDGKETVTLFSNDGLFDDNILAYDKEYRYTFKKTGTYSFNLKDKNLKGTITVEP